MPLCGPATRDPYSIGAHSFPLLRIHFNLRRSLREKTAEGSAGKTIFQYSPPRMRSYKTRRVEMGAQCCGSPECAHRVAGPVEIATWLSIAS